MKELTLQDILNMSAQELVDFFTSLSMEERMTFYNSLLDRHKDYFADQIESIIGVRKFSDIAAEHQLSANSSMEKLETLAKEENDPAAQYYLSRAYLKRWQEAHPHAELSEDYVNEEPTMEAMRNDWENALRWAIECTEQNFNEGLYAQAQCYDRTEFPPYYTKKLILDFQKSFAIIRYEAVTVEKYNREIVHAAIIRLGEIYRERDFAETCEIDEMRRELRERFAYRKKVYEKEPTEENKLQTEYALDNLRYYDERRITVAERLLGESTEDSDAICAYCAFHKRMLEEIE